MRRLVFGLGDVPRDRGDRLGVGQADVLRGRREPHHRLLRFAAADLALELEDARGERAPV
jgi:hypothetical protein